MAEPQPRPASEKGPRLSRRHLLLGSAAVALAGSTGAVLALRLSAPAEGYTVFNDEELGVIRALSELWFPAGVFPVDGLQAGVPRKADEIARMILLPVQMAGFRYVLRTLEWGTVARWGKPFTELTVEERGVVVGRWSAAEPVARRTAIDAVKAVLAMAYFSHPDVLQTIGWRVGCGLGKT